MKTFYQALVIALAITTGSVAQDITWRQDVDQAVQAATRENKLVLLHFYADWCRPCKHLDKFVFTNTAVAREMEARVVPVKLDVDLHPDLVKKYGVQSIPMDVCVSPTGRVIKSRKSPRDANGYIHMLSQLQFADPGKPKTALEDQMQQLIASKTDTSKTKNLLDFTPEPPTHQKPQHSLPQPNKFAAGQATQNNQFQPPSSNPSTLPARNSAAQTVVNTNTSPTRRAEPKRILNDRFFAENEAPRTSAPQQSTAIAASTAKIATSQNQPIENRVVATGQPKLPQIPSQFESSPFQQQRRMLAATNQTLESRSESLSKTEFAPAQPSIPQAVINPTMRKTDNRVTNNAFQPNGNRFTPSAKPNVQLASSQQKPNAQTAQPISNQVAMQNDPPVDLAKQAKVSSSSPLSPIGAIQFALHGKCPVTLIQKGEWVDGDQRFGCHHRGKTFIFRSADQLAQFQQDPDKFSPLLAGFDPVIYHEKGELVDGKETHGVFMGKAPDQRVVLFHSVDSLLKFQQDPRKYLNSVRQAMQTTDTGSNTIVR